MNRTTSNAIISFASFQLIPSLLLGQPIQNYEKIADGSPPDTHTLRHQSTFQLSTIRPVLPV